MIKISDYLDYLNNEIIQARKKIDENAIKMAKEYDKHEYLKYFKVPRFTMPTIKMDIPLKVSNFDSQTMYNFQPSMTQFISDVNMKVDIVKNDMGLNIAYLDVDDFETNEFNDFLGTNEDKNTKDLSLNKILNNIDLYVNSFLLYNSKTTKKYTEKLIQSEMKKIMSDVLKSNLVITSSKLNDLYIDPDTTKTIDKDKVIINLHVEMVEEAIRIVKFTDAKGKEIEEITFD